MIVLKYPEFVREREEEEWIWEDWEEEDWEEEEQGDLPICFGDYGRCIDCMFCSFAVACFEVKDREEGAMVDVLGLLED